MVSEEVDPDYEDKNRVATEASWNLMFWTRLITDRGRTMTAEIFFA
jgi:hypothetical protein